MSKHLNPLEKEFLIRQYKSNNRIKMSDFCEANHISTGAFQKWIKQYDEGGLEGLARADSEIKDVLPEGIDRTEESYKREILKLRIENERLKKNYVVQTTDLDGLADVVELLRGKKEPTIIHTDQGSVYSSKAYNELIQDSNIVRSMSRAGKPTDNPVNEALNGWIKEELFIDFRLEECRTRDAVKDVLCRYVAFYNRQRPCFAIGYDTPDNYCKRFYRGELEKKDTFSKRILTEEPKFVQK